MVGMMKVMRRDVAGNNFMTLFATIFFNRESVRVSRVQYVMHASPT
jgi:hypothetical protein